MTTTGSPGFAPSFLPYRSKREARVFRSATRMMSSYAIQSAR